MKQVTLGFETAGKKVTGIGMNRNGERMRGGTLLRNQNDVTDNKKIKGRLVFFCES